MNTNKINENQNQICLKNGISLGGLKLTDVVGVSSGMTTS